MEVAMNKRMLLAVMMILAPVVSQATSKKCFSEQKVDWIDTGYVDGGTVNDPDYGDAVGFNLADGRRFSLNKDYNLDHPRGMAMHRTLLASFVGGYPISAWDHSGGNCDVVDEIEMKG